MHTSVFIPLEKSKEEPKAVPIKLAFKGGESKGEHKKNKEKESVRKLIPKTGQGKKSCPDSYGGIGVITVDSNDESEVLSVAPGYPASKAGIMVGDVIMNRREARGTPGTEVVVIFSRNGVVHTALIKRELICSK